MFILARLIIKVFKLFIAIIVICIFLLRGCDIRTKYDYLHDVSMVESVQIVNVGDYNKDEKTYGIRIIEEIDDDIDFVGSLKKVKCTYWIPLFPAAIDIMPFEGHEIMVQINYSNGDWEWINISNQVQYRQENGEYHYSFKEFNEKQFLNLIETYAPGLARLF